MMQKLFLASEINVVAKHIAKKIKKTQQKLKAAFINTAAEPETGDKNWLKKNRQGLVNAGFDLFDYSITGKNFKQINKDLADFKIIHLNGGNTFYLLLQARKSGFDKFIRQFVEKGGIYTSSSAGSIIASPNIAISKVIEKKSYDQELKNFASFNLVDFIILPHWGRGDINTSYRLRRLKNAFKEENKIILLNDYQYVEVKNDFYKIVDIRSD